MIKGLKCKNTAKLYQGDFVKRLSRIERSILKRLRILDSAETLESLANLPSNRLEVLKVDTTGNTIAGNYLFFDNDGNGSNPQVQIATLNPRLTLTHKDFIVI